MAGAELTSQLRHQARPGPLPCELQLEEDACNTLWDIVNGKKGKNFLRVTRTKCYCKMCVCVCVCLCVCERERYSEWVCVHVFAGLY